MALSINISDILKFFRERGVRDSGQVTSYVKDLATSAIALAEVWREIYQYALEHPLEPLSHDAGMRQRLIRAEVNGHYLRLSSVLAGRLDQDHQQELAFALGELLHVRNLTLESYEDAKARIWHSGRDEGLKTLHSLVEQMQERAGDLKALSSAIANRSSN
jgi:hypothetical protein